MTAWPDAFDLAATLSCGQCFRWRENADGTFTGVASGRRLTVSPDAAPDDPFWRDYFDLSLDYASIRRELAARSPVLAEAAAFAPGIRILR